MKKLLAFLLAMTLVFTSVAFAFADEEISGDALICQTLGMLKGDGNGVTPEYLASTPTRLQTAIMFLRLTGREEEALAYTSDKNFADADTVAWEQGRNVMAYLYNNPDLGWIGDGGNFNPNANATATQYYKVMLQALGYKQNTSDVIGDFTWAETLTFAAEHGLKAIADVDNFTVNDLATGTVEALQAPVKDSETTLIESLIEMDVIAQDVAEEVGLAQNPLEVALAEAQEAIAAIPAVEELTLDDEALVTAAAEKIDAVLALDSEAVVDADGIVEAALAKITELQNVAALVATAEEAIKAIPATVTLEAKDLVTAARTAVDAALAADANATIEGVDTLVAAETTIANLEVVAALAANFDSVVAVTNTIVDVTMAEAITAANAENFVVTDAAGAAVAVTNAELSADGETVTLTTATQTSGAKYTLTIGTVAKNFVGGVADTTAPTAISAAAVDNTSIDVTFTDANRLDVASATNVANYTIAGLTIVSAEVSGKVVTLTTSAQTAGTVYTVSVNGVKDVAGNAITSAKTSTFAGRAADVAAPSAVTAVAYSNTQVVVTFTDSSNIDEASAENIANYTIAGLTVVSAELLNSTTLANTYNGTKDKSVLLTTAAQATGTVYTVSVLGVKDVAGNAITTAKTSTFAGRAADTAAPSAVAATAFSNNQIVVTFTDASNIDEASAEDVANYTIANLTVVSAELLNTSTLATTYNGTLNKSVLLTTAAQTTGIVYTVSVLGVKDIAGNAIATAKTATFAGRALDVTAPTVVGNITTLAGNKIQIVFSETMDGTSVQTLTNYAISTLGYPISVASWTAATKTLVLNTAPQSNGTIYTVTINNVKDTSGNAIKADTKLTFAGIGSALDAPALSSVTALDNKRVKVVFNKDVDGTNTVQVADFEIYKGVGSTTDILAPATGESVTALSDSEYIIYLGNVTLTTDVYTLKVVGSITDYGNTAVSLTTAADCVKTFGGVDAAPIAIEILGATQVSARQFIITFNQDVSISNFAAGDIKIYYDTTLVSASAAAVDTTDYTKVKVTFPSDIPGEKVAEIRVTDLTLVDDVTGNISIVANDTTNNWYDLPAGTITYTTDTLKVSSVTMVDEQTIEIAFNQDINFSTLAAPDDDNFVQLKVNGGAKVAGYDIKQARKTASDKVRIYFTAGANFVEGTVYSAEIQDHANGDALFTSAINGTALDASVAANAKGTFGYNPTENAAPYLMSAVPLSANVVQLTFSESLSADPTTTATAITDIEFYNGSNQIAVTDLGAFTDISGIKTVYTVTLQDGVFAAGTTYTVKVPSTVTLTDKYTVDTIKTNTASAPTQANVTFGGVGTVGAATVTAIDYTAASDTLVLTGTNFTAFGQAAEDIKAQIDWTKLVWDINNDGATTGDVTFAIGDITSATVTNATTLTIVLAGAKGTALEATGGYGAGGGADNVEVKTGFLIDTGYNSATTDAADLAVTIH